MLYLLAASLVWAFSFGLVKHVLIAPGLDPSVVAAVRLAIASLALAPFLRIGGVPAPLRWRLATVGFVQYGLMYLLYTAAFTHLPAHQVAAFTIFTPLYVTLLDDAEKRRLAPRTLGAVLVAVAGAGLVLRSGLSARASLTGFLLVQGSNACFALGQLAYRRLAGAGRAGPEFRHFGLLYAGGLLAAAAPAACGTIPSALTGSQVLTLLYLGLVPSGLGFLLWNVGACRCRPATLAVMNNAKIPLAVLVSILVFGESADIACLVTGLVLMGLALWACERRVARDASAGAT
jgi:drug/metabolite transporter (DMT)-like permease